MTHTRVIYLIISVTICYYLIRLLIIVVIYYCVFIYMLFIYNDLLFYDYFALFCVPYARYRFLSDGFRSMMIG